MERRLENQSHLMIGMSVSIGTVHKNTKYAIYFTPKHGSCHEYPEGCKLFIQ
jgi:hypothetical protein